MAFLTLTEERFITHAALQSTKSDLVSRHGCVITSNGKIIGRGYNSSRTKSSDGFLNNTCSCHAEIAAIRDVVNTCSECTSKKFAGKKKPWVL
jgi:tRNA(Arg) A34 adenosine deaminase TadA|tara:strand:+ start:1159 stop:1437 length:279 start_codon:yes stop_codon:yes gene_type:complete